ncbi:hypothetical protein [Streptomyces sp. NRRL F-5630]|uniref:hypothetical protein n=1 Tax=Streptomyces sp. NRRL F-5630 TaxID=1463864 RepID=UPI003EBF0329
MVLVASLLLPFVAVLLFAMDRVEDWMGSAAPPGTRGGARGPRSPRTRHLRLVHSEEPAGKATDGTREHWTRTEGAQDAEPPRERRAA